jgi:hypothetical protein
MKFRKEHPKTAVTLGILFFPVLLPIISIYFFIVMTIDLVDGILFGKCDY